MLETTIIKSNASAVPITAIPLKNYRTQGKLIKAALRPTIEV